MNIFIVTGFPTIKELEQLKWQCTFWQLNTNSLKAPLQSDFIEQTWSSSTTQIPTFLFLSPPNSKCLHLLIASILLDLQFGSTHSSLKTIFFVVLAWEQKIKFINPKSRYHSWQIQKSDGTFFRKIGLVWPPYPLCFLSYLLLPVQEQFSHMINKFITHHDTNEGLFTLSIEGILSLLVLGNFVRLVLLALFAVSPAGLWNVHLQMTECYFQWSWIKVLNYYDCK